jgi:hypothetical protein
MEHRRRIPRHSTDWFGICHIEGESDPDWRDCRVVDMSTLGLGIMLHHFWPAEIVGRRISVDAPAAGDSVNIRLEGVITNAESTPGGVVRVGIEFDGPSESELAIATVLGEMIDSGVSETDSGVSETDSRESETVPAQAVVSATTP